jgi:Tfp pilus assembly protein PilO
VKARGSVSGFVLLIPIAVIAIAGYVVFGKYKQIQALRAEQADIRQDIKMIEQNLAALSTLPDYDKFAAAPRSEAEQAAFIESLRLIARDAGVEIESFRTRFAAPRPPPKEGQPESATARYQPMPTMIVVVGPFAAARDFAYSLMRMDRLMNTSEVRWELDEVRRTTRLSFVVTRYVRDPLPTEINSAPEGGTTTDAASGSEQNENN